MHNIAMHMHVYTCMYCICTSVYAYTGMHKKYGLTRDGRTRPGPRAGPGRAGPENPGPRALRAETGRNGFNDFLFKIPFCALCAGRWVVTRELPYFLE